VRAQQNVSELQNAGRDTVSGKTRKLCYWSRQLENGFRVRIRSHVSKHEASQDTAIAGCAEAAC